jgi:hypothetical protein
MTTEKKFTLMFVILLATIVAGTSLVSKTIGERQAKKDIASLAIRQCMLTQGYCREYISELAHVTAGTIGKQTETLSDRLRDKDFGRDSFIKTRNVFETTLDALINGGKVPLDLAMTRFTTIPPAQDSRLVGKLEEVKQLWNRTEDDLKKLTEAELNPTKYMEYAEYKAACDTAHNSANATMKAMVEASKIYIDSPLGENWEGYLRPRIVPPIVIVLLVMGIGWLFFSHRLIKLLKGTTGKLAQSSDQDASASEQTITQDAFEADRKAIEEVASAINKMRNGRTSYKGSK